MLRSFSRNSLRQKVVYIGHMQPTSSVFSALLSGTGKASMPFGPCYLPLRSLLCSSLVFLYVSSTMVNVYIDDQTGDSATGILPTYVPPNSWNQGAGCDFCATKPDPSQALGGTWHDASYSPGGNSQPFDSTLQFNGMFIFLISSRLIMNHP